MVFSMVRTVASIVDLPKQYSFVVFETLYRMRKTRKMGHFNFSNQKSLNNEKRRKTRVFLNGFFSMVGTVASISNLPKLCSFVVLETLYRMRKTRKMGHFNFPNQKSLNNEKRRKTWVFFNGFLHGWHSGQYC